MRSLWKPVATLTMTAAIIAGCSNDSDAAPIIESPEQTSRATPRDVLPFTQVATSAAPELGDTVEAVNEPGNITDTWGEAQPALGGDQTALIINPSKHITNPKVARVSTDGTRYIVHITGTNVDCNKGSPTKVLIYVTTEPGIPDDADHKTSIEPQPGCLTPT